MTEANEYESFMRRAIELGKARAPQLPFAALLVEAESGRLVAEGWNRTDESPLWHGEMDVINTCARSQPGVDWTRLTLYSTAEPCPMCQAAILWAGIPRVVYGTSIRYLQSRGWSQIDIAAAEVVRRTPFCNCILLGGILEEECNRLFESPPPRFSSKDAKGS